MNYKFKIGDTVQIISNSAEEIIYHYAPIGAIGVIDEIDDSSPDVMWHVYHLEAPISQRIFGLNLKLVEDEN